MQEKIPSIQCCDSVLLGVEQLKNLPQGNQFRNGIRPAREALTEIRTGHPVRHIDDHTIDFDFQASSKVIAHTANHLAFPAKERV